MINNAHYKPKRWQNGKNWFNLDFLCKIIFHSFFGGADVRLQAIVRHSSFQAQTYNLHCGLCNILTFVLLGFHCNDISVKKVYSVTWHNKYFEICVSKNGNKSYLIAKNCVIRSLFSDNERILQDRQKMGKKSNFAEKYSSYEKLIQAEI